MLTRRFTSDKDICLLTPTFRFKLNDIFKCDYNYDSVKQAYRYYIFIPHPQKLDALEQWEITQNTYYKLVNNSTEC